MGEPVEHSAHVSYFEPYVSKTPWHEDQLTRGYLALLRLVPSAHLDFIRMMRDRQQKKAAKFLLPAGPQLLAMPTQVLTQCCNVPRDEGSLVSVLLSDEYWTKETIIEPVERDARYDGLICYGDQWIITIENKPHARDVWEDQLRPALRAGSRVRWEKTVVSLTWGQIVNRLQEMVAGQQLNDTERMLVEDFLDFVERHFDYLKPHNRLDLCGRSLRRLNLRCREVLKGLALGDVQRHKGWGWVVEIDGGPLSEIKLEAVERDGGGPAIELVLYPGVGCPRSRALLENLDLDAVCKLQTTPGWHVYPDLSLRFRGTGYVWGRRDWDLAKFIAFWRDGKWRPTRYYRGDIDFDDLFAALVREGAFREDQWPEFRKHFSGTQRTFIEVVAALGVKRTWSLPDAVALDHRGEFVVDVGSTLKQAMRTWGQALPVNLVR